MRGRRSRGLRCEGGRREGLAVRSVREGDDKVSRSEVGGRETRSRGPRCEGRRRESLAVRGVRRGDEKVSRARSVREEDEKVLRSDEDGRRQEECETRWINQQFSQCRKSSTEKRNRSVPKNAN